MSFARRGENGSHVYIFESERGYECNNCSLINRHRAALGRINTRVPETGDHFVVLDNIDMIRHLGDHMKFGDTVPQLTVWELARAHFDDEVG